MTNTNTAAAGACLVWVLIDAIQGKISVSGACSGIVVGLVASKLPVFCLENTVTERIF
jgi:ammonia channel protein AmtB